MIITAAFLLYLGVFRCQYESGLEPEEKPKQEEMLIQYYQLNLKIFGEDSDIKDIEELFQLFSDDFTYVHQAYGGVYSRQDLYNGYRRNLELGEYTGEIYDIRIFSVISGKDALAVSKRFVSESNPDPQNENGEMAVFEFQDGKIYRITEYW